MTTRSVPALVLLPGAASRLLGLPVDVRNARVAARCGAEVTSLDELASLGDRPAVVVPPSVAIEPDLFPLPDLPAACWLEAPPVSGSSKAPAVLAGPARALHDRMTRPDALGGVPRQAVAHTALLDVSTGAARRTAGWLLLRRTAKPTDGWISRHLNRPVSQTLSYVALHAGVSANAATWFALGVGVISAAVGAQPGWAAFAITGVLFHFASVLDGVDGEIARTTLTESREGARFDALVDRVTAIGVFAGVMVGWAREGAGAGALAFTAAVGAALGLSLWRAYRFVGRHAPGSPLLVIDGAIRRAADRSRAPLLWLASRAFALLRRDLFALIFMGVGLTGVRALVPALVAFGIVLANVTFSIYGRNIAAELGRAKGPAPRDASEASIHPPSPSG